LYVNGNTPLHNSVINGYLDKVDYLVQNGAEINEKNNNLL